MTSYTPALLTRIISADYRAGILKLEHESESPVQTQSPRPHHPICPILTSSHVMLMWPWLLGNHILSTTTVGQNQVQAGRRPRALRHQDAWGKCESGKETSSDCAIYDDPNESKAANPRVLLGHSSAFYRGFCEGK